LGAAWILSFYGHTFHKAMNRGTHILFGDDNSDYVYQLTRIRYTFVSHAHVEAVAFNSKGHYFMEASNSYPPIILTIPNDCIVHHTFE
jgi:hypothetical protein